VGVEGDPQYPCSVGLAVIQFGTQREDNGRLRLVPLEFLFQLVNAVLEVGSISHGGSSTPLGQAQQSRGRPGEHTGPTCIKQ
jgi:hypothetical protein